MQINQIQKDLVEINCTLLKLKYGIKISEKAKLGYLNGKSWEKKHRRRSLGSYYFKHNQKQFECEIPRIWIESMNSGFISNVELRSLILLTGMVKEKIIEKE